MRQVKQAPVCWAAMGCAQAHTGTHIFTQPDTHGMSGGGGKGSRRGEGALQWDVRAGVVWSWLHKRLQVFFVLLLC